MLCIGLKELNKQSNRNRNILHHTLDSNEEDMSVEDSYKRKLLYGLAKIRRAINVSDEALSISNTRRIRERYNIHVYRALTHYGLCHVIPTNLWNVRKLESRISQIFTIQDEAFVLLLMMNNWKVWENMAKDDNLDDDELSKPLFTNTFKTYNGVKIKIKGWNNEGLREFNETANFLTTVRNMDKVIEIETELKEEFIEMKVNRRAKRKSDNNDELILADRVLPQDGYSQTFIQR